jgi:hypothetical protein
MSRLVAVAALATATLAATPTAGAQSLPQYINAAATEYVFTGCNAYLCSVLTLFAEPISAVNAPTPGGRATYVAFGATHTYRDAGNGLGVVWWTLGNVTYAIGGLGGFGPGAIPDRDALQVHPLCGGNTAEVPHTTGGCVDDPGLHRGFIDVPFVGSTATINYSLAPLGLPIQRPGAPLPVGDALQLQLVSVKSLATPEPATLALVAGGLALVGTVTRRRRA